MRVPSTPSTAVPTTAAPTTVRATALAAALMALMPALAVLTATPVHAMPVDNYAPYQGQVSCDPTAKPGVIGTRNLLRKKFGGGDMGITRSCGVGGLSEHKEGRAWDWGLNANRARDRRIAKTALTWLTKTVNGEPAANARNLGVMYLIWDRRMFRLYDASAGWQPYDGASPHRDHIHLSFTWNGAMKRTAWWTRTVQPTDYGPCPKWHGELAKPWTAPNYEPCPEPLHRPKANQNGVYRAQHGETVGRVARWFGKSTDQIRRWNDWPATGAVEIHPGQRIYVIRRTSR